jgi:hypothetical protein
MTTFSGTAPAYMSNSTDFQNFCAEMVTALGDVGLVQTADTGQINTATVALPGAGYTAAGYTIWRFADALQATAPVFLKIEFGTGASVDRPAIWVTTGNASSGTGTLTGTTTTRTLASPPQSKTAGVYLPVYAQGDGGGVIFCWAFDTAYTSQPQSMVCVDRTCDGTGTETTDGVFQLTQGLLSGGSDYCTSQGLGAGNVGTQMLATGTGQGLVSPDFYSLGVLAGGIRLLGLGIGICPAMVMMGQLRFLKRFIVYNPTDMAGSAITVSATNFGAAHTYLLMQRLNANYLCGGTDNFGFLWE